MIIVRITSGLGNQLFQYATARSLADKHQTVLKIDRIGFVSDRQRDFRLDCFNIDIQYATLSDLIRLYPLEGIIMLLLRPLIGYKNAGRIVLWLEHHVLKLQKNYNQPFSYSKPLIKGNLLVQRFYHFDMEIARSRDNLYMIGYFQSWKYFSDIRLRLLVELQLRKPAVGQIRGMLSRITESESVAIHVRRGDYFSDPDNRKLFEVFDMQYFSDAIQQIRKNTEKPVFFVFSDDVRWVKRHLVSSEPLIYVELNNADHPEEDLRLMSHCRHAILSNSSFSWWGAWLNQHPGKIVIVPQKWLNNEAYNTRDLLPPEWIHL
ncbi:MAG: alpha-1,2-fucosyltransferase [Bacteroidales bacterium]|nr:alpha-1,2-fucosyltransferase [Bacteroidales bacterium]MBN2761988.1 alpha-1,2-fucosyltransferase [Bacteroidales bacterium]